MFNNTKPTSIRQICLAGFIAGDSRAVIADRIKAAHPTSMAAQKSAKHIAWHYGDMKKAGLLVGAPKPVVDTIADVVAEELKTELADTPAGVDIDQLAAELAARVDAALEASA